MTQNPAFLKGLFVTFSNTPLLRSSELETLKQGYEGIIGIHKMTVPGFEKAFYLDEIVRSGVFRM